MLCLAILYRGYVYDNESSLYYLQSRYYDPFTGRFINADDTDYIGFTETVLSGNIFAYCENNPVLGYDPKGCYDIIKFNCYSYAFGINNKWLKPKNFSYNSTLNFVKNDVLDRFGDKVRVINGKNSSIKKGEYRVALRIAQVWVDSGSNFPILLTLDFHFWKQNPKTLKWWNKHGQNSIESLGKANPNKTKTKGWILLEKGKANFRFYRFGSTDFYIKFYGPLYYNSKTIYFAYRGKFTIK